MRRTKIVATLGPASDTDEAVGALISAGVDVFRLNFSHGLPEEHGARVKRVRRLALEQGRVVAIMQDLQGPRIRTGKLAGGEAVWLREGNLLTITSETVEGTSNRVSTTYADLPKDVRPGDRILLDDGLLELKVLASGGTEVSCRVVHGGLLGEHKGINLPGVRVGAPSLTVKDAEDFRIGLDLGVDYIALSFVRSAEDVLALRRELDSLGAKTPLISKLEKPEALENLEAIVEVSDGLMVARGDLGVEIEVQQVPVAQKRIIEAANRAGKPVITATQMLQSMIDNPVPTRAEASDVANAILDGTDAVMLSGETAVGRYPVEAVRMMAAIACQTEPNLRRWGHFVQYDYPTTHEAKAVAHAAVDLAQDLGASLIVAFTRSGQTARYIAQLRPAVSIVALTSLEDTCRSLALSWGVTPLLCRKVNDLKEMATELETRLLQADLAKPGDTVVLTGGLPVGEQASTNFLRLLKLQG